ncbi:alpha/beta fold hydrolase [Thalassospira sp.]|uniref:alpha/beta fold hydrolase n=1 Tax=Thalassospira sp. TaxID=1912094 RepID=UPI00273506BF|nr:alpha/beta hydrolase [Thalassospira sp.]MDP2699574.1 alpha/beta hydrolase [Thalassospira sp.]
MVCTHFIDCCGYEIHIRQWGTPDKPALVMWHGLARLADDFDIIASRLADDYFILCPDTIGRGLSGWAKDPDSEYTLPFYGQQALAMLDHFGIKQCDWLGTSMGGLIGMGIGALAPERIRRLILNDIGPELDTGAVARIKAYVGTPPLFETVKAAENLLRFIYAPFGIASDAQWAHLAARSVRRVTDGRFAFHYDPAVMTVFAAHIDEFDGWDIFSALQCPILLIHGARSDLITPAIVSKMCVMKPEMQVLSIAECGHAPYLNTDDQISAVHDFLQDRRKIATNP